MAPLLNDPGVASAVTTRLRGSGSGAENDSLCRWLYDTFWSNVPELQLAVLLLVPSLARAHLCRAMSRKPLAGFEAVLLALYAHAASQHGAGEVETRDHVTPEPGKDFGTSKREPVGKIEQVFILINIRETHWYLVVIHARNMEIQVLDSLGTTQDHKDLTDSIKGLQRQIDMISQRKELKDHKWPDLQVASWSLREIDMGYAKQTDSSSCGLFLLNYIEYWTRDELSDSFTQGKMAAILLSSDLNKRRGCLLYKNEKEVDSGSPSDVEILENPTDSNKRKLLHMLDDSEVVYEDEEGPITQADLQRWFVDDWDKRAPVKVSTDGCTNDFLMVGLSTKDMPVTKADSIDVLCDYIMAIKDDAILE
uniref:Ubiquitin-like protease family profile domain-containing protein n=1 Tax=Zea mays TaxID=4577 RepID=A0A804LMH9_MAIZE